MDECLSGVLHPLHTRNLWRVTSISRVNILNIVKDESKWSNPEETKSHSRATARIASKPTGRQWPNLLLFLMRSRFFSVMRTQKAEILPFLQVLLQQKPDLALMLPAPSRSSARSILTFLHSCNAILHAVMQFLNWSTARTWSSPCFLLTSRVTISCCSDIRGSSSCPTLQSGLRSHVSMPLPYSALQICILSYRSKLFLLQ